MLVAQRAVSLMLYAQTHNCFLRYIHLANLDILLCILVRSRPSTFVIDHARDGLNLYKGLGSLWRIIFFLSYSMLTCI